MKEAKDIFNFEVDKIAKTGLIKLFYEVNEDKIINIIINIQKEAYNQAIDNAASTSKGFVIFYHGLVAEGEAIERVILNLKEND